jgi:hypothetical protein
LSDLSADEKISCNNILEEQSVKVRIGSEQGQMAGFCEYVCETSDSVKCMEISFPHEEIPLSKGHPCYAICFIGQNTLPLLQLMYE